METVEQEIQRKGLNAPRITPEHIDNICHKPAQFHRFPGTTVTVCALEVRNGYVVVGKSAAASIENFDEALGRRIAYDDAKRQVWSLEGYLLRERLFQSAAPPQPPTE